MASGLNTFGYVGGNPVGWIDQFGLEMSLNLFPVIEYIHYGVEFVVPPAGFCAIAGHGSISALGKKTPAQIAQMLKSIDSCNKGQPIILYSCETGKKGSKGEPSFADNLANVTGREVIAPDEKIWIWSEWVNTKDPKAPYEKTYIEGNVQGVYPDSKGTLNTSPDISKPGNWVTSTPK